MRFGTLFRSGLLGLAVGSSLFLAGAAQADSGAVGSTVKLPQVVPTVSVKAWGGQKLQPGARRGENARFTDHEADHMHVAVGNAHHGTEILVERQKQSHDVELPTTIESEQELRAAAVQAQHFTPLFHLTTDAPSVKQTTSHLARGAEVAWPNTRYRVRSKTRDGQELPPVAGIVTGVVEKSTQRYDPATDALVAEPVSGKTLPSARAWAKPQNIFVSEPARDLRQMEQGDALMKVAAGKLAEKLKLEGELVTERAKGSQGAARVSQLTADITRLGTEATNEQAQGKKLLADGDVVRVRLYSVGGAPASASLVTTNARLKAEGAAAHAFVARTDGHSGYASLDVHALPQDELETVVQFPPVANASVGSSVRIQHRVPDRATKPAFEMGGLKYYRLEPSSVVSTHDAPIR